MSMFDLTLLFQVNQTPGAILLLLMHCSLLQGLIVAYEGVFVTWNSKATLTPAECGLFLYVSMKVKCTYNTRTWTCYT